MKESAVEARNEPTGGTAPMLALAPPVVIVKLVEPARIPEAGSWMNWS